jgi:hypothetical protein
MRSGVGSTRESLRLHASVYSRRERAYISMYREREPICLSACLGILSQRESLYIYVYRERAYISIYIYRERERICI